MAQQPDGEQWPLALATAPVLALAPSGEQVPSEQPLQNVQGALPSSGVSPAEMPPAMLPLTDGPQYFSLDDDPESQAVVAALEAELVPTVQAMEEEQPLQPGAKRAR